MTTSRKILVRICTSVCFDEFKSGRVTRVSIVSYFERDCHCDAWSRTCRIENHRNAVILSADFARRIPPSLLHRTKRDSSLRSEDDQSTFPSTCLQDHLKPRLDCAVPQSIESNRIRNGTA